MPELIKLFDNERGKGGRMIGIALPEDRGDEAVDNVIHLAAAAYPDQDIELSIYESAADVEIGAWFAQARILAASDDIEIIYSDAATRRDLSGA